MTNLFYFLYLVINFSLALLLAYDYLFSPLLHLFNHNLVGRQ